MKLDPGQHQLDPTQASQGSAVEFANHYRFAGVPDEHGVFPPATEANAHQAGVNAATEGRDLTDVVIVGMARYPGTIHDVATLIAAACLGWFTTYARLESERGDE